MGIGFVNWNISIVGSVVMGVYCFFLRENFVVVGGVYVMDIVDVLGMIRYIECDDDDDEWFVVFIFFGFMGVVFRLKMSIYLDIKVWVM